jgi:cytochrome c oxidase cbb3-type subunit III
MKLTKSHVLAAAAMLLPLIAGCNHLPGATKIETVERPDSITDFHTLYSQNCAGCHGAEGRNGAAINLANPVYQAWVDDASMRKIIANGQPGTQMPAFAQSAGGMLTNAQVDALVQGMRKEWKTQAAPAGIPSYAATLTGNAEQGQKTYQTACARCHEQAGHKVVDPTYLALVSDQTLRSIIVAGRDDLGHPDWRGDIQGQPMTDQEITDVVAWLASQRVQTPGQPYPHAQ